MKNIHIKPNRGLHFCISRCNLLCNLVLSLYIRGFVTKVTGLHWLHLFYTKNIFFYFLSYISNRNRQQQYLLLFCLILSIILFMSYMISQMKDMGLGSSSPLQQMQQGFQNTMQQIQNDPFPLIEQFLGQRAMSQVDQAMQPMQQEAIQKVSGVMSGIRSLVNEAFPNMGGGGMSTTGQVGQGIASLGGTAIPAAPFTKPAEIPSTPMQPPTQQIMSDLSQISTPNYIPQSGFGGDPNAPQINYTPEQIGNLLSQTPQASPPPGVSPVDPSSVGLGGNPMILQPPMTDPTTIYNPAMEYNPAINYNVIKPAMDESGGAIDFSIVDNPASTNINDILAGQGGFPKIGADVGGPVTSEEAYNPAMEYFNPVFPMPIQKQVEDPLINLAYNFNMENSPF